MESDRENLAIKSCLLITCLAFGLLLLTFTCTNLNRSLNLEDDNPYEEIIEKVIESQFDVDVDLTPESEEPTQR